MQGIRNDDESLSPVIPLVSLLPSTLLHHSHHSVSIPDTSELTLAGLSFQWRLYKQPSITKSYINLCQPSRISQPILQHTPVILVALMVLVLPSMLLSTYPPKVFRKCLAHTNWQPLHMFVKKFQGDYKDGTQGTYDYRFLSGIYLVFRILHVVPLQSSNNLSIVSSTLGGLQS